MTTTLKPKRRKIREPFNQDNSNSESNINNLINSNINNSNINSNLNILNKTSFDQKIEKDKKKLEITEEPKYFYLNVQGLIESGSFFEGDSIYCKYDITFGPDWKIESGQKSGQSQHACQGEGADNYFVWNMPFEICLKSTNPTGWPQLVVSCFCPDFFGREVVKAYGTCFFPTTSGSTRRTLSTFSPISSSFLIEALGVFLGEKAEIRNPSKVLSTGEGREIIRTQSEGSINVSFNCQLTNMDAFGYDS